MKWLMCMVNVSKQKRLNIATQNSGWILKFYEIRLKDLVAGRQSIEIYNSVDNLLDSSLDKACIKAFAKATCLSIEEQDWTCPLNWTQLQVMR